MSLQVTKIKNIPIKLHFTLIIVFFLITWMLTINFMPRIFPGLGTYHYLTMGIVGAVILFISVTIHELAHSILSIKYGVRVHQIMLFIFGGVSDIKEEPKEYGKEFKIAIVGPIASFVLAGLFAASFWTVMQIGGEASSPFFVQTTTTEPGESMTIIPGLQEEVAIPPEQQQQTIATEILPYTEPQEIAIRILSGVLVYGSIINVLLGAFNLLPAFPLDGGRVLRAALYRWRKNYDFATKTAVKVGTYISYGIMGFGFVSILFGSFIGGFWLILIGWFLQSGAQTYLQNYELSSILSKIRLKNIMNTRFIYVDPKLTVKELIDGFF
ncbi:MAG: site-2 protease family protein, partial [Nitrososphaeraceae archaeon]